MRALFYQISLGVQRMTALGAKPKQPLTSTFNYLEHIEKTPGFHRYCDKATAEQRLTADGPNGALFRYPGKGDDIYWKSIKHGSVFMASSNTNGVKLHEPIFIFFGTYFRLKNPEAMAETIKGIEGAIKAKNGNQALGTDDWENRLMELLSDPLNADAYDQTAFIPLFIAEIPYVPGSSLNLQGIPKKTLIKPPVLENKEATKPKATAPLGGLLEHPAYHTDCTSRVEAEKRLREAKRGDTGFLRPCSSFDDDELWWPYLESIPGFAEYTVFMTSLIDAKGVIAHQPVFYDQCSGVFHFFASAEAVKKARKAVASPRFWDDFFDIPKNIGNRCEGLFGFVDYFLGATFNTKNVKSYKITPLSKTSAPASSAVRLNNGELDLNAGGLDAQWFYHADITTKTAAEAKLQQDGQILIRPLSDTDTTWWPEHPCCQIVMVSQRQNGRISHQPLYVNTIDAGNFYLLIDPTQDAHKESKDVTQEEFEFMLAERCDSLKLLTKRLFQTSSATPLHPVRSAAFEEKAARDAKQSDGQPVASPQSAPAAATPVVATPVDLSATPVSSQSAAVHVSAVSPAIQATPVSSQSAAVHVSAASLATQPAAVVSLSAAPQATPATEHRTAQQLADDFLAELNQITIPARQTPASPLAVSAGVATVISSRSQVAATAPANPQPAVESKAVVAVAAQNNQQAIDPVQQAQPTPPAQQGPLAVSVAVAAVANGRTSPMAVAPVSAAAVRQLLPGFDAIEGPNGTVVQHVASLRRN